MPSNSRQSRVTSGENTVRLSLIPSRQKERLEQVRLSLPKRKKTKTCVHLCLRNTRDSLTETHNMTTYSTEERNRSQSMKLLEITRMSLVGMVLGGVRNCVMSIEPSWQSMNTGRTRKGEQRYHHLRHCCRRDVTSNPLFRASGIGETL